MNDSERAAPSLLRERVEIHHAAFPIPSSGVIYARRGRGPSRARDNRIPQPTHCVLRRLSSQSYVWNRISLEPSQRTEWPVVRPESVALIELRGETVCFRMRNLAFFEPSIRLSTIVSSQLGWAAFESPCIASASGHGRLAFRFEGAPIVHFRREQQDGVGDQPVEIMPGRVVVWSADSEFTPVVKRGVFNAWTFAEPGYRVERTSLLLELGRDEDTNSDASVLARVARLIVP
jgi:hypothetical protein